MALVKCTECGTEISDRANACIKCGCPMSCIIADYNNAQISKKVTSSADKVWIPNAKECIEISSGTVAKQWEENDKQKIHCLFAKYPYNTNSTEVKEKVKVLDKTYSTQIHRFCPENGLQIVSEHICSIPNIDKRLSEGDIFVVDEIANTKETLGKWLSSFSTKYSYFSNPAAFPICDRNVCQILFSLNNQVRFINERLPKAASELPYMGGAPFWKEIIETFKTYFDLQQFSYREIDLYLSLKYRELEK